MRATSFTHDELKNISHYHSDEFGNTPADVAAFLAEEVLYQRQWIARAARIIEAQTLDLKSLGKGRREALERTVYNLRDLAVGKHVAVPYRLDNEYRMLLRIAT